MGKALFGSLYVHPSLSVEQVSELGGMDLGSLSLEVHPGRDAMTVWPGFDEGDGDMRRLVTKLRSWNESVFMNAFVYSDVAAGGEGQEWVVIDDEIQRYFFGTPPEYIKPWLSGRPPEVRSRVPLDALQRLTAHALRIAELEGDALTTELRALGEAVPDRAHARALLNELHAVACSDFELSEAHWLDWRVRRGVLGVMVARIAFPEDLGVPKSDFEYSLTEGWLREHASPLASDLPRLMGAASALERRTAAELLSDHARDLGVQLAPSPMQSTIALERAAEYYGDFGGFLIRTYEVNGVAKILPELVAAMRGYAGEVEPAKIQAMLEWHAFVCRQDAAELFAEALKREPELSALAEAGKKQCS